MLQNVPGREMAENYGFVMVRKLKTFRDVKCRKIAEKYCFVPAGTHQIKARLPGREVAENCGFVRVGRPRNVPGREIAEN